MTIGPGKYDDICSRAREEANALAAVVIIVGGAKGSGFSVTAVEHAHESVLRRLPDLLENMAAQIRKDMSN